MFSVAVYDTDGLYVRSFGEGTLGNASDITAANDGRVMVVDWYDDYCVHIFSEDGDYLGKFFYGYYQGRFYSYLPRIAFHQLTESVVIAVKKDKLVFDVKIFTKDGEFVRSTQIHEERLDGITGMTVTKDGRIAVLLRVIADKFKVLVI